jgi:hypothetical protein
MILSVVLLQLALLVLVCLVNLEWQEPQVVRVEMDSLVRPNLTCLQEELEV